MTAGVTTVGHRPLEALRVFGATAYLEAVLVLDLSGRQRALLATREQEDSQEPQATKASAAHGMMPV